MVVCLRYQPYPSHQGDRRTSDMRPSFPSSLLDDRPELYEPDKVDIGILVLVTSLSGVDVERFRELGEGRVGRYGPFENGC